MDSPCPDGRLPEIRAEVGPRGGPRPHRGKQTAEQMAVNRGTTQAEQGAPNGCSDREGVPRGNEQRPPGAPRSSSPTSAPRGRRRRAGARQPWSAPGWSPPEVPTDGDQCDAERRMCQERRNGLAVAAVAGWRCVEASKTRPTHAAAAAAIPGAASASQDRPCGGAPRGVGISTAGASTPGSDRRLNASDRLRPQWSQAAMRTAVSSGQPFPIRCSSSWMSMRERASRAASSGS